MAMTELGGCLALAGDPEMDALGEALHAFLACDRRDWPRHGRTNQAQAILERWGVGTNLRAADAVTASDRLWDHLQSRFRGARIRREVPVHALVGSQEVVGGIDVSLETDDGFVIVDHMAFSGGRDLWGARAGSHAPQLALYAGAVATVTGTRCRGAFVHLPLVGIMVQVGGDVEVPCRDPPRPAADTIGGQSR